MSVQSSRAAQEFFQSHVRDYDRSHYSKGIRTFMTVRLDRMLECVGSLALMRGSRVLDAGCGPGHLLAELAGRGFDCWGVDTSAPMLRVASDRLRRVSSSSESRLQLASIEKLPFRDGSFDLVCSAGVIEYLEDDAYALSEFNRVLRPGGSLVLSATNLWSPAGYLDFLVEAIKRQDWFLRPFNKFWQARGGIAVRPRNFRVRRHRPSTLRRGLADAGYEVIGSEYFYMLPWPHPFDRLFPQATAALSSRLERYSRGWTGPLAEGYLVHAAKRRVK